MPSVNNKLIIRLKPISAVSPSLAETLRDCALRAALSRISEIRCFILGNPKAWLGTAYHDVLEKLWSPSYETLSDEELIEHLWRKAIDSLQKQARSHSLNKRFAEAVKWPGYYLAYACVQIRAQQALTEQPRRETISRSPSNSTGTIREQDLSAMDGKLIGKPDVVSGNEVRDYKSGNIYQEAPDGVQIVKHSYVRQLRLYGHLVHETRGYCPNKGKLLPMLGEAVEIELDPEMCAAEAVEAVNLLDSFNAQLAQATEPNELATPSPSVCRWCQYKVLCNAFWNNVHEGWAEELGSSVVCGVLTDAPVFIHHGSAFSLSIRVTSGTTASSVVTISPLDSTVNDLSNYQKGDVVRVVNLYKRHDGQLAPTSSTLCLQDSEFPLFTTTAVDL